MEHKSFEGNICPVARSLGIIGEWWSLLIIRDALLGVRRFTEFQQRLGLARNVLSTRLKKLVSRGILEMVPASDGSSYQEYVLTEKGRALLPVLVALRQWGDRFLFSANEAHTELVDKKRGRPLRAMQVESSEGKVCQAEDLALVTVGGKRGKGQR